MIIFFLALMCNLSTRNLAELRSRHQEAARQPGHREAREALKDCREIQKETRKGSQN
jgi:hypothetical protein